ncbi:MAG: hypothetical protein JXB35_04930 [Anaerolineae bacterium]|nr:hypothetical protein [Anaerolineae bacterium]
MEETKKPQDEVELREVKPAEGAKAETIPQGVSTEAPAKPTPSSGQTFKEALEKSMESLGKALNTALEGRGNVVMVRVNDDALEHLDMLIEAEITKSRSESAAFLINEGIKGNATLFNRMREITDQITALREQLRQAMISGPVDKA